MSSDGHKRGGSERRHKRNAKPAAIVVCVLLVVVVGVPIVSAVVGGSRSEVVPVILEIALWLGLATGLALVIWRFRPGRREAAQERPRHRRGA